MKFIFSLIITVFLSDSIFAADQKNFNLVTSYNNLTNISNEPETTPVEYPGHQEINLNFYIKPAWQLELISATSTQANYKFYGFGFKIQTPGTFFFGANTSTSKKHRSPFDTTVHAELLRMFDSTTPGLNTNFYTSRAGFTLDWMPAHNEVFFLSFDLSTFIIRSDLFIKTSVGLGIEI